MAKVEFQYENLNIMIQCQRKETMKDIFQKFANKAGIELNNLYFLYNGEKISNLNLTFEEQANTQDKNANKMNIIAFKYEKEEKKKTEKEIMTEDLEKKGEEILNKHLDGRTFIESKVDGWIKMIIDDFEKYFKEKYPSYYYFLFCNVSSKKTYFDANQQGLYRKNERLSRAGFSTNDIYSTLRFFYFKDFKSNVDYSLKSKIIFYGNKLLYDIFDERNNEENMSDYCDRMNKEHMSNIHEFDKQSIYLFITFAINKPLKNFAFIYKTNWKNKLNEIIQTFQTSKREIFHFVFMFTTD